MNAARQRFVRGEMLRFAAQARFNRTHFSAAEAECWNWSAAEALQALGGLAAAW
ncbi:hypothetical protein [Burkholderia gladioli]|uniref:hypothetical protein n=1 Tax=Burkholderia gladioli TaxID=28095 RepID=UPI0016404E0F|nr:hypothetical protein [Burkholderia gladioli]